MDPVAELDQAEVGIRELGLAADCYPIDPLSRGRDQERVQQALERLLVDGDELQYPELVLGAAGGEGDRVPQREADE